MMVELIKHRRPSVPEVKWSTRDQHLKEEGEKQSSLQDEKYLKPTSFRSCRSNGSRQVKTSSDSDKTVLKVRVISRAAKRWNYLMVFSPAFDLRASSQTEQPQESIESTVERYRNLRRFPSKPKDFRGQLLAIRIALLVETHFDFR